MKNIFLFFIIFKTFICKDLTIFYTYNLFDNTKSNLQNLISKLDILKSKYPNSLRVYIGDAKEIEQEKIKNYLEALKSFKFDALLADINQVNNKIKELPLISCNILSKKLSTKFNKYINFCIENIKISVIGMSNYSRINSKLEESTFELKATLELIKRNFNPNLVIILSDFSSKELIEVLQKNKNTVLLLQNSEKVKHFDNYITGKIINENELGAIHITFEGDELIDYKSEIYSY